MADPALATMRNNTQKIKEKLEQFRQDKARYLMKKVRKGNVKYDVTNSGKRNLFEDSDSNKSRNELDDAIDKLEDLDL